MRFFRRNTLDSNSTDTTVSKKTREKKSVATSVGVTWAREPISERHLDPDAQWVTSLMISAWAATSELKRPRSRDKANKKFSHFHTIDEKPLNSGTWTIFDLILIIRSFAIRAILLSKYVSISNLQ